jgi:hypothetical protein
MRLKAIRRLGEDPIIAEVSQVVVEANDGTPVAVIHEVAKVGGRSMILAVRVGDPQFQETLRQLGLHQTVIVDRIGDHLASRPADLPLLQNFR